MKEINKGTLEKAALKVGISQKTARKYIKQKRFPNEQKGGGLLAPALILLKRIGIR